ncbi:hypothetical protein CkaCkLH20_07208 [Colletotrichum karsti]|uniref:AB hydrolase-1 domain-containing protein n=1 Tax=Colletotrichum karsti TaxID=1095194 RepID=A0A9P6I2R7_9PEZI|nr:uncharacterized protein CkaCkLH20_07208 [Colletotrichum karsti]KAF9875388.1 hypothetical protein CkaCkLH20_07208 [Colletotrichum karsti]
MDPAQLPPWDLPEGVASRFVDTSPAGLKFHILESVPPNVEQSDRPPLILLLHGFPNLSYDWSAIMPMLSRAGYHVVAPDMRGFGRTHNSDLTPIADEHFRPIVAVHDVTALLVGLGHDSIHTLVGHDLGAFAASLVTVVRKDLVKSLILMSHPFKGIQGPSTDGSTGGGEDIQATLARLDPPRKHYKYYNASPEASDEWTYPTGQPLHDFLRGYFHLKSADYSQNQPRPLEFWTAKELAVMPHYYVMRADLSMRGNIELDMSQEPAETRGRLADTPWLPDSDLCVYTKEYGRTTFSKALLWYRALVDPKLSADLLPFAGTKISVPTMYISGDRDWGTYQVPGALEAMQRGGSVEHGCWRGAVHIPGAGHWVNMEKPEECAREILNMATSVGNTTAK